jgi:septum formation protein
MAANIMDKAIEIYLGSKSPRRQALLKQMGVHFQVLSYDIPEDVKENESPDEYSVRVTAEKLNAGIEKIKRDGLELKPLLCSDTEVVVDNQIYGKPLNYDDAFQMIKSYSGKRHRVITSVGLAYKNFHQIILNETSVYFAEIKDFEIKDYLSFNSYMDKAGAYGIQSYIGQYIEKIDGCFFSVMGLPLNTVRTLLNQMRRVPQD